MSKKPDDAARIAGLTNILQASHSAKQAKDPVPSPALPPTPAPAEATTLPTRRKKEKIGKYRDPNFHHYGVYLRTASHKQANRRLEDTEPGKDFSDLMQELLDKWLASE